MLIETIGTNEFVGAKNVFIYNQLDAEMYDKLYHFMDWPSIDIDIVSYKLLTGKNLNFTKAYNWMVRWTCPVHEQPQYVMVTTESGFTIYCNVRESIQYLRHWGFDEDIRMVRINVFYRSYRKDYEYHYENEDLYNCIKNNIYDPAIEMMDNLISNSKYEYSYYPYHSDSWSDISHSEQIYIVDPVNIDIEAKLLKYIKEASKVTNDDKIYERSVNTIYIDYAPLGQNFCEDLRV